MQLQKQQELMELSTPVVVLWEGILALPLIGTLDSARTQVVMGRVSALTFFLMSLIASARQGRPSVGNTAGWGWGWPSGDPSSNFTAARCARRAPVKARGRPLPSPWRRSDTSVATQI